MISSGKAESTVNRETAGKSRVKRRTVIIEVDRLGAQHIIDMRLSSHSTILDVFLQVDCRFKTETQVYV